MITPRLRSAIELTTAVFLPIVVAACGPARVAPTLETVTFAPSLDVAIGEMVRGDRGLFYRDLAIGTGAEAAGRRRVSVYYAGSLADGTPLDEISRPEPPISFRLGAGEVIAGWDRGIAGMRVGGRRQLVIPPALGYGARGTDRVPPNSVLVFTIELVEVR
ncbi:MAG TPA: FKBP-type peptidyl-prolyl cis-trans isomerase [Gemmatimonadaceae bacterium]|nr:FKBP-type peptidyl-prolyl cis-trans isomerase [Gemmatimonadaceae bacterium]